MRGLHAQMTKEWFPGKSRSPRLLQIAEGAVCVLVEVQSNEETDSVASAPLKYNLWSSKSKP
jgi:hypothetical protein